MSTVVPPRKSTSIGGFVSGITPAESHRLNQNFVRKSKSCQLSIRSDPQPHFSGKRELKITREELLFWVLCEALVKTLYREEFHHVLHPQPTEELRRGFIDVDSSAWRGRMEEHSYETFQESFWERRFGITLAIFAAALAINDLGAGKFGDDELKETNEKSSAYMWYQSKGIKESLAEGQHGLLLNLLQSGAIAPDKARGIKNVLSELESQAQKYKKEKQEILLGSAAVGKENWVQEVDGKLGLVIGAKEREKSIDKLSRAGDIFDIGTLCLQLCLVLGAIGLLLKIPEGRKLTFSAILTLGTIGSVMCARAYWIVLM